VPDDESALLPALSPTVTSGWGMILVQAIGSTEGET
jgi:hypothetical protein